MSWYLLAAAIAALALLALVLLAVRAAALVRRFAELARTYRRHLAAEAARVEQRRAELLAELSRRRVSRRRFRRDDQGGDHDAEDNADGRAPRSIR